MPCALSVVLPAGFALSVANPLGAALPTGSLVREAAGVCAVGVPVEVLAVNGVYGPTDARVGDRACLPADALVSAEGWRVVVSGDELGGLPAAACGEVLGSPTLAGARVARPETLAGARRVQAAYAALFGPVGLDRILWTEAGYVGLPLTGVADLAAAWRAEGLDTPARREKAVVAEGPRVGEGLVYAHFEGTDAPGSDRWGDPDAVVAYLGLFAAWYAHCTGTLAADPALVATPATCTVQVGDLAWFNAKRPDPLGHLDHYEGTCADVRLFRTDGSRYEAWWDRPDDRPGRAAAYNRGLTAAFLAFAMRSGVREAWFGDPVVVAAVPGVGRRKGHDDHLHVCF